MLAEHGELKQRLQDIEKRLAQGFAQHKQELQEIRFLIAQLEKPIERKKSRIGF
jgi:soluble cytochrome b562